MSKVITTGFLFKPTHTEIHFLKEGHGSPKDSYEKKFTTDVSLARKFECEEEARKTIYSILRFSNLHSDYDWTPVLANGNGKFLKDIRPIVKIGSSIFKRHYRDL